MSPELRKIERNVIIPIAFFLVSLIIVNSLGDIFLRSKLFLDVRVRGGDIFQLFFDTGNGYRETESRKSRVLADSNLSRLEFRLPGEKVGRIRIDPGGRQGTVVIKEMCLKGPLTDRCWKPAGIKKEFRPLNDISLFEVRDDLLYIEASGSDPSFEYYKSDFSGLQPRIGRIQLSIIAFGLSVLLFIGLLFEKTISDFLDSRHAVASMVRFCVRYRYAIALAFFAVLVVGKLHGSSLPCWDKIIKEEMVRDKTSLIAGKARDIRSDEWLIQTPFYFSQAEGEQFFPLVNKKIRSEGQNMLLSFYAPVFDMSIIGKPFNWGYLLFGKEYGLSWYWWSRLILLFLLSFEISLLLTERNTLISLLGAFWVTFSPFIQWVYSLWLIDLIIYFQAIVVAAWYYLNTDRKTSRFLLASALTMSFIGYIFSLYPRFQVPLVYLMAAFLMAFFYDKRSTIKLGKYDVILGGASFVIVAAAVVTFVLQSTDAIKLMLGTVYPGRYFNTGGNYEVNYLQLYLIDWLLPYKGDTFWNEVELATFLNFLPAILLVFFRVFKLEARSKHLGLALFLYILFLGSWLVIRFPEWFAQYSLMRFVSEHRLHVLVNLAALYLSLLIFHLLSKYKPLRLHEVIAAASLVTALYYYSITHTQMLGYLKAHHVMITLLFFFLLNIFFLSGRKKLFATFVTIYIVAAGLTVNPLARGTGPVDNKVATKKIMDIEHADPDRTWAGVNSIYLGSFLMSLGIKTFNGFHYYPDLNMWKTLDPEGRYTQVYNRYAFVQVRITKDKTYFELDSLHGDVFTAFISSGDLGRIGVKYLFSNGELPGYDSSLREVDKVEADNLYIYEVKSEAAQKM